MDPQMHPHINAGTQAENLKKMLQDIIAVLTEENTLLETPQASLMEELVGHKQRLFQNYEQHLDSLKDQPNFSKEISTEQRDVLKSLAEEFAVISKHNETKLAAMMASSQQIMQVIQKEAMQQTKTTKSYTAQGKSQLNARSRAAAVTINQQL